MSLLWTLEQASEIQQSPRLTAGLGRGPGGSAEFGPLPAGHSSTTLTSLPVTAAAPTPSPRLEQ